MLAKSHRAIASRSKTYAELHRKHPARRVLRTVNWACSAWAAQHHRCPGGHLKLRHGLLKAAANRADRSSS